MDDKTFLKNRGFEISSNGEIIKTLNSGPTIYIKPYVENFGVEAIAKGYDNNSQSPIQQDEWEAIKRILNSK